MNWNDIGEKKFPKRLVWGAFLIVIIVGIYSIQNKEIELSKNGVKSSAIIISYEWGVQGIKDVEFQFKVEGVLYTGYAEVGYLPCALTDEGDKGCIGTTVNIIYSSRDPEINKLILESK